MNKILGAQHEWIMIVLVWFVRRHDRGKTAQTPTFSRTRVPNSGFDLTRITLLPKGFASDDKHIYGMLHQDCHLYHCGIPRFS